MQRETEVRNGGLPDENNKWKKDLGIVLNQKLNTWNDSQKDKCNRNIIFKLWEVVVLSPTLSEEFGEIGTGTKKVRKNI